MNLIPLQKVPNNVGDLGKIIFATSFECLPKVQKNTKSGLTGPLAQLGYLDCSPCRSAEVPK